jgi:hypothetical protein
VGDASPNLSSLEAQHPPQDLRQLEGGETKGCCIPFPPRYEHFTSHNALPVLTWMYIPRLARWLLSATGL